MKNVISIVNNNKGFLVIKAEADFMIYNFGFGAIEQGEPIMVCAHCNDVLKGNNPAYYVAVLNDVLCEECYKDFISTSTRYAEDAEYERDYFNHYLNIAKAIGSEIE